MEFAQEITIHHLLILGAATKITSAAVKEFRLQVTKDKIVWYNVTNELTHTEVSYVLFCVLIKCL